MGKRALLLKLLQDVRASYWFLPTLLVIFGILFSVVSIWFDTHAGALPFAIPQGFIDTQADGARSTLAVIAQSIIGVTGVMFSMTLVAVSFASGSFGPRLIGNFMRDRGNQWSLGILISTFVYALMVLRAVQDRTETGADAFVPQYSLLIALGLTVICIFTLIYFIHHVPETINVSRIAAGLGNRLEAALRDLIDAQPEDRPTVTWPVRGPDFTQTAPSSGYVQTCNFDRLCDLAKDRNWYIKMQPAIGDFVTPSTVVFAVWCDGALGDGDKKDLRDCYALGMERTEHQNPSFLAHQLVEMAARALSPGVNDPYTALDCLNRLNAALTIASVYKSGLDPQRQVRLSYPQLTFERLFAVTFPLCRQYLRPDQMARKHALLLLAQLETVARDDDRQIVRDEIAALTVDENETPTAPPA